MPLINALALPYPTLPYPNTPSLIIRPTPRLTVRHKQYQLAVAPTLVDNTSAARSQWCARFVVSILTLFRAPVRAPTLIVIAGCGAQGQAEQAERRGGSFLALILTVGAFSTAIRTIHDCNPNHSRYHYWCPSVTETHHSLHPSTMALVEFTP